jgi:hypothetical protein
MHVLNLVVIIPTRQTTLTSVKKGSYNLQLNYNVKTGGMNMQHTSIEINAT